MTGHVHLLLLLALAGLMSGCVSGSAWRHVSTSNLQCAPMQVVIARGKYIQVRRIQGVALAGADETDHPLRDVSIVIRRLGERRAVFATTTNESGAFEAPDLPAGWYQLETCLPGFDSVILPVRISSHAAPAEQIVIRLRPGA
jgi:hypothetical protein